MQEELNKYKPIDCYNYNSYNNFNNKLKVPIHKLNYHSDDILCSPKLKNGRFVTGSDDNLIIIFNNKTFKADLTIKQYSSQVNCIYN